MTDEKIINIKLTVEEVNDIRKAVDICQYNLEKEEKIRETFSEVETFYKKLNNLSDKLYSFLVKNIHPDLYKNEDEEDKKIPIIIEKEPKYCPDNLDISCLDCNDLKTCSFADFDCPEDTICKDCSIYEKCGGICEGQDCKNCSNNDECNPTI